MKGKSLNLLVITSLVSFLLMSALFIVAQTEAIAASVITVDSTADDYHDGKSKTCLSSTPCTLRRAVNQAYTLAAGGDTVEIRFAIPLSDPGYLGPTIPGAWKITLTGSSLDDLRELYGRTTVDGTTQPNGRATGPKIVVDGQKKKNYGLILRNGDNVVRGLAMQNFMKHHVSVSSANNTVEKNWFGLSADGQHLSAGDDLTPEGGSGVVINNSDDNVIKKNVLAGFFGASFAITGDNNVFAGNKVGTRSNGTVPLPGSFTKHPCMHGAWVGGSGINVSGENNQIGGPASADKNVFAGLFLDLSATSTQPPAIWVQSSKGHLVQNNIIGQDGKGKAVGVCGRGLDLANGPKNLEIVANTFNETRLSAIVMNNSSLNGNLLRGNIFKRKSQWPGSQGSNTFAEDAIAYGPFVPDALRNFHPAKVTSISGTTVSGTSGDGSPCPNCVVELLMDDNDGIKKVLKSLAVTTADNDGDWTANLAAPLGPGMGIRTMSTVPDTFTIAGLDTNSTSNLSELYMPPKPLVAIAATDAVASEPGVNKGTFKFTRTRSTAAVTVLIKVQGTATAATDYEKLPAQVKIPSGANSVLLKVKPIDNSIKEGNETVIVTILPSEDYDIKPTGKATVIIKDDD